MGESNEGVVLRVGDSIEVLRADNIPTRVIFPKVPDNLRARPTLSVTVESGKPGARDVRHCAARIGEAHAIRHGCGDPAHRVLDTYVAPPAGIEPATNRLEGGCSIR